MILWLILGVCKVRYCGFWCRFLRGIWEESISMQRNFYGFQKTRKTAEYPGRSDRIVLQIFSPSDLLSLSANDDLILLYSFCELIWYSKCFRHVTEGRLGQAPPTNPASSCTKISPALGFLRSPRLKCVLDSQKRLPCIFSIPVTAFLP